MSSYLNLYLKLKPKEDDTGNLVYEKPVMFASFCSSHPLYEALEQYVTYGDGDGDEGRYTKLTPSIIQYAVSETSTELSKWKSRITELEKHAGGNMEIISEIIENKEYLGELQETYTQLLFIKNIVDDLADFSYYDAECLCAVKD